MIAAQVRPSSSSVSRSVGGRDHLSYSAVTTYQQCPLRFKFKYVLGLPETTISATLLFGQAVHKAVQFHFEQLLAGLPAPDLDTLLAVFWDAWKATQAKTIRFAKAEDINAIGHLADRLLRAFVKSDFAHPGGTIIGVEEELRGVFVRGCPEFLARVDLLVDAGDALVLSDFKTSRSFCSQEHVTDSASQVLLYGELAQSLRDGKPLRLQFAVLTKAKWPALTLHEVRRDTGQILRTKRLVEQVWRGIQAGNFYPIPSPLNCPTCPFRGPCQQWRG